MHIYIYVYFLYAYVCILPTKNVLENHCLNNHCQKNLMYSTEKRGDSLS